MKAAQVALAALSGVLVAAAVVMFITNDNAQGWIFTAFGLFGFLVLLMMIVVDAGPTRRLPPPPR